MDDLNVPNLDAMDDEELQQFARNASILYLYAQTASTGRAFRKSGDVNTAMTYELRCDQLYRSLPQSWKW